MPLRSVEYGFWLRLGDLSQTKNVWIIDQFPVDEQTH